MFQVFKECCVLRRQHVVSPYFRMTAPRENWICKLILDLPFWNDYTSLFCSSIQAFNLIETDPIIEFNIAGIILYRS